MASTFDSPSESEKQLYEPQIEGSQVPQADLSITLEDLERSFEKILKSDDYLAQDYELLRQAQDLKIDPHIYVRIFDHYRQRTQQTWQLKKALNPLVIADRAGSIPLS